MKGEMRDDICIEPNLDMRSGGGVGCSSPQRKAWPNEGAALKRERKAIREPTKIRAHMARLVCAVASRSDSTRARRMELVSPQSK